MEQNINIDDFVDYKKEYSSRLRKVKEQGDKLTSLCPFHNDTNASFSVDCKRGMYTCFACGSQGNYIRFRAQMDGCSTKEAFKKICSEYGRDLEPEQKNKSFTAPAAVVGYSLKEYSFEKKLPEDWLQAQCGVKASKERNGMGYIYIPYLDIQGKQQIFRKRYPKGSGQRFKWSQGSAGKLMLYGEWKIPQYYEDGKAILVEGESDTQTLWYLGFNAMGVPGASIFKAEWVQRIGDIQELYLHIEPDQGGETYYNTMIQKLKQGEYHGKVYIWSCKDYGVKDPSELYIKSASPEEAKAKLDEALARAKYINLEEIDIPAAIEDAPKHLRVPEGWKYNEEGIFLQDIKTLAYKRVCRTPIILTRRLKSLDTGEEKIEVAFKRDDKWHTAIHPRSTIFQSRNITVLADLGCTVTSENAKQVVSFLGDLEAENIDIIEKIESTATFGWQPGGRFLPGNAPGIVVDVEPSMQGWASGYGENGSLEDWVSQNTAARGNFKFRFILASTFAAPLLKLIGGRNIVVYNWADSKGGKTATLKAALSAWGHPDKIMATFNATQVALERMAGIFNDLPMGLDERQLAGTKTEFVDKLVYMLSNGAGRIRGSKTGTLQAHKTWRSIIIATGEEPIVNDKSMDGVATRMIEIAGAPFDSAEMAGKMHAASVANFGFAGPKFVQYLMRIGEARLKELHEHTQDKLKTYLKDVIGRELDSNKLAMVATVALADALSNKLFWNSDYSEADSIDEAIIIAGEVVKVMTVEEKQSSTNQNAAEFLNDWLFQKSKNFGNPKDMQGDWYGFIDEGCGLTAYVLGTILHDALEKGGYNHRKTMKYLVEQGIIKADAKGKFAKLKKVNGHPLRMVEIDMERLTELGNESPEESYEQLGIPGIEVEAHDLPF